AKEKFLHAWGTLGSNWGINRTMAQIHALLLISPNSLTTEEVMEDLKISRGNANMNLRDLIGWGLIYKEIKPGERMEFFYAEKDIWKAAKQIIKERRKRELEPVLKVLEEVKNIEGDKNDKKNKAFVDSITHLQGVVEKADYAFEKMVKFDENAFVSTLLKLLK
ncbi:MAG: transcriptional regulator, partial [Bacteroidia bacterium]|nr:transcriptional regulator [Bacteroidia bacterium]